MAEYRVPTQAEINRLLYMQGLQGKTQQQIIDENLVRGIAPIPENVFQRIAGGARAAGEFVNRAGSAADIAKLFPGYKPETKVTIPTGYSFAPKQAPTGEVIPGGLQTQSVNLGQVLGAIKPADVLGISGAERAYTDIGLGKAPQPLDVLDVAGLGATGLIGGKAALQATKGLPVGMSIQEAKGLLQTAPKSDIGFYSAVEQAAMASPRKSGAGQAFLNDIMKGQDVRADEIKWMGLDEFLKGKQNITKQEVQDYIANNRVNVQEVRSTIPRLPGEEMPGDQGSFLPKFGSYTLPGGENYRELLLTMPSNRPSLKNMSRAEYNAAIEAADKAGVQDYISSHFPDQPNILAHLRVNDRVDADGKKMLLIEEVQSDWHQAGREKGYMTPPQIELYQPKNLQTNYSDFFDIGDVTGDNGRVLGKVNKQPNGKFKSEIILEQGKTKDLGQFATKEEAFDAIKNLKLYTHRKTGADIGEYDALFLNKEDALSSAKLSGVPDAPFKDTWYQLALKRAIQHAAENGYDRIGLTTGSQQAARFDLSKQVDEVIYSDQGVLYARGKDGETIINQKVPQDKLADYIGKEAAEKLIKTKEDVVGSKVLSGVDLKVGGEGMKKYYDEIYPKFLDKYGKKWGARVGETKIQTRSAKEAQEDAGLLAELGVSPDKISTGTMERIRYLDITPEMKAGVSKGQPLFQAAPIIGTGLLGQQEER